MKIIDLPQKSPEWKEWRTTVFTASNAPAMMGASNHTSRLELLDFYDSGTKAPVNQYTQELFDRGDAAEEAARPIAEAQASELFGRPITFAPRVAAAEDADYPDASDAAFFKDYGMGLAASFDGLTEDGLLLFEHKLDNKILFAAIDDGKLPDYIVWQIEHQMLVSGAKECWFVTSDGTESNMSSFHYHHEPMKQRLLVDGWIQFAKDLKEYSPAKDDPEFQEIERLLDEADENLKYWEGVKKAARDRALEYAGVELDPETKKYSGGKAVKGNTWQVSVVNRSGEIAWHKACSDLLPSDTCFEKYRSSGSTTYSVRRNKK